MWYIAVGKAQPLQQEPPEIRALRKGTDTGNLFWPHFGLGYITGTGIRDSEYRRVYFQKQNLIKKNTPYLQSFLCLIFLEMYFLFCRQATRCVQFKTGKVIII